MEFPIVSDPWWNGYVWGIGIAAFIALILLMANRYL
jgi:hypothetical protein